MDMLYTTIVHFDLGTGLSNKNSNYSMYVDFDFDIDQLCRMSMIQVDHVARHDTRWFCSSKILYAVVDGIRFKL